MSKLSRLEWACLVITVTVVMVMTFFFIGRPLESSQESEFSPVDDDLEQLAGTARLEVSGADADVSPSVVDQEFPERVRDIPRPDRARIALSASGKAESVPGNDTNKVAVLVPPPRVAGTNDILAALAGIAEMPWGPQSEQLLKDTVAKWAQTDPLAALDYALGIESRRVREALVNGVFSAWVKADLKGAYSWLVANRDSSPDTFRLGLKPVFTSAAAGSVPDAMRMALDLGDGADRMVAIGAVMGYASKAGAMASMVSYMESFQTDGERNRYASLLAQNWAYYAPEQAAAWALSLSDPKLKGTAMSAAVSMWAADNPNAAVEWVMALPEGNLRSQQMARITKSWARYDPVKAADWILSMRPPATSLDPAVRSLVGTIMTTKPDVAVMWASTIADPTLRSSTIMIVAREWMKSDPKKASAYVAAAPLTPAQRRSILGMRR